jgi:hypothetical protein
MSGCLSCRTMTRINRTVALSLAAVFLLAVAAPAGASGDGEEESAETTETTVAAVPINAEDQPAVMIPPSEPEEREQPWTARYLIPLLVVTAIVLVIGVAIAYNHSVRHRYEVVS